MKNNKLKTIALCLCAVLILGGIASAGFALKADRKEDQKPAETKVAAVSDNAAVSKDETVYVLTGADGSVQKVIVSDWLRNALNAADLDDQTELTDPQNVGGDQNFNLSADGSCVWDAQGNDIYYQGNIAKELPVDLQVSYKLNGTPIPPAELVGKSGRVSIRFDYQNKQYEMEEINGKQEKIYVPFTIITGVYMDNDIFTNIEVSKGRIINDGDRTFVVGMAFPGLQENLAVSKEKFDIPYYLEITADAKDFALGMTLTFASNELFNELDTDDFKSVSDLSAALSEMADAVDQLLDGSDQLADGLDELLEESSKLTDGIDELATGSDQLKAGAGSLDEGAADLQSGAQQLVDGLNNLAANSDSLNGGARQVFDSLCANADQQLAAAGLEVPVLSAENYAEVLNGVISSLDENAVYYQAPAQVTAAVEAERENIARQVSDAVRENVSAKVTRAVREQVEAQVQQAVQDAVAGQVIQAALGIDKATYDAAAGAASLKAGTDDLKAGTSQLYEGGTELSDGILALKDGVPDLIDGISKLRDGVLQLSDGISEFKEQGIQKLIDAVDDDLDSFAARFRATEEVSHTYRNFAGINADMDGRVKFIYRTDSVE